MHLQPSLGQAEAYINVHLSRSGPGHLTKPMGPFVTVSREAGAGGHGFARMLAARLDHELPGETPWTVFDRNLVEAVLQSEQLSPRIARFLPEDKVSEIGSSIGELLGLHPSIWSLTQRTNQMMRELARAGHVILVGRGANFATDQVASGLHVRLVAPPAMRAAHLARELGIGAEDALGQIDRIDAARRNYVRSVFGADVTRACDYDLVCNLGRLPLEQVVDLAATVLRSRIVAPVT